MRVLLVRLDHAGDCVLTVPPIARALLASLPDTKIALLTTSVGETLLRDDPHIDRVIVFDPPWSVPPDGLRHSPKHVYPERLWKFITHYWRRGVRDYDAILYLSHSPWERLLALPFGRRRVGFAGPYNRRLSRWSECCLTDRVPFHRDRHVLENCYDIAQAVVPLKERPVRNDLFVSPERKAKGAQFLWEMGLTPGEAIAIHPSNEGSMKSWPQPAPLELGRRLATERREHVVYLMSQLEYEPLRRALAELVQEQERIHHLVTSSFEDFAGVVSNVKLLITNDGGPMHVASALGVPTVAIFGPTNERVYGPLAPTTRVLRSSWPCQARHLPWHVECDCGTKECLRHLSVDEVYIGTCAALSERESSVVSHSR